MARLAKVEVAALNMVKTGCCCVFVFAGKEDQSSTCQEATGRRVFPSLRRLTSVGLTRFKDAGAKRIELCRLRQHENGTNLRTARKKDTGTTAPFPKKKIDPLARVTQ